MSPEQWGALPWWQQQMYIEGFEEEGFIKYGDGEEPAGGFDPVTAPISELRGLGLRVVQRG